MKDRVRFRRISRVILVIIAAALLLPSQAAHASNAATALQALKNTQAQFRATQRLLKDLSPLIAKQEKKRIEVLKQLKILHFKIARLGKVHKFLKIWEGLSDKEKAKRKLPAPKWDGGLDLLPQPGEQGYNKPPTMFDPDLPEGEAQALTIYELDQSTSLKVVEEAFKSGDYWAWFRAWEHFEFFGLDDGYRSVGGDPLEDWINKKFGDAYKIWKRKQWALIRRFFKNGDSGAMTLAVAFWDLFESAGGYFDPMKRNNPAGFITNQIGPDIINDWANQNKRFRAQVDFPLSDEVYRDVSGHIRFMGESLSNGGFWMPEDVERRKKQIQNNPNLDPERKAQLIDQIETVVKLFPNQIVSSGTRLPDADGDGIPDSIDINPGTDGGFGDVAISQILDKQITAGPATKEGKEIVDAAKHCKKEKVGPSAEYFEKAAEELPPGDANVVKGIVKDIFENKRAVSSRPEGSLVFPIIEFNPLEQVDSDVDEWNDFEDTDRDDEGTPGSDDDGRRVVDADTDIFPAIAAILDDTGMKGIEVEIARSQPKAGMAADLDGRDDDETEDVINFFSRPRSNLGATGGPGKGNVSLKPDKPYWLINTTFPEGYIPPRIGTPKHPYVGAVTNDQTGDDGDETIYVTNFFSRGKAETAADLDGRDDDETVYVTNFFSRPRSGLGADNIGGFNDGDEEDLHQVPLSPLPPNTGRTYVPTYIRNKDGKIVEIKDDQGRTVWARDEKTGATITVNYGNPGLNQVADSFDNIPIMGLGQAEFRYGGDQLVISNIGSSGEDGVSFIAPPNVPRPANDASSRSGRTYVPTYIRNKDGKIVEIKNDRGQTVFIRDEKTGATITVNYGNPGLNQGADSFDNIPIEPLGLGQASVALNRNGQLVVSNIGSSGEDGVSFIAPPNVPRPANDASSRSGRTYVPTYIRNKDGKIVEIKDDQGRTVFIRDEKTGAINTVTYHETVKEQWGILDDEMILGEWGADDPRKAAADTLTEALTTSNLVPLSTPGTPSANDQHPYDKLTMEIWTNGSISSEMALVEAAKIYRKHLNPFEGLFPDPTENVPLTELSKSERRARNIEFLSGNVLWYDYDDPRWADYSDEDLEEWVREEEDWIAQQRDVQELTAVADLPNEDFPVGGEDGEVITGVDSIKQQKGTFNRLTGQKKVSGTDLGSPPENQSETVADTFSNLQLDEATAALGEPLTGEESTKIALGAVLQNGPFTLTADYFQIDLADRLTLTQQEVDDLIAVGITSAGNLEEQQKGTFNILPVVPPGYHVFPALSFDGGDSGFAWSDVQQRIGLTYAFKEERKELEDQLRKDLKTIYPEFKDVPEELRLYFFNVPEDWNTGQPGRRGLIRADVLYPAWEELYSQKRETWSNKTEVNPAVTPCPVNPLSFDANNGLNGRMKEDGSFTIFKTLTQLFSWLLSAERSDTLSTNDGQSELARVGLTRELHEQIITKDKDESRPIVVAIIDSGVDLSHPELWGQLWRNKGEIPFNRVDDDRNGYVDDVYGYNTQADNSNIWDDNGHGTAVAGIIAARWDDRGIDGIAPNCRVMTVKAFNKAGQSDSARVALAIRYAVLNGANIIHISAENNKPHEIDQVMIDWATENGVLVIAASGSNGRDTAGISPANLKGVLTVGACNKDDKRANFSGWGRHVDLVAPGVNILSLRAHGSDFMHTMAGESLGVEALERVVDERWYRADGTSFAAPLVTGVAAALWAKNPKLSADQIKNKIVMSCDDIEGLGWDNKTGAGRLNAAKALVAHPDRILTTKVLSAEFTRHNGRPEVAVTGQASGNDFKRRWLQVAFGKNPSSEDWQTISSSTEPVKDGLLGHIPGSHIARRGTWTIRSIVQDEHGNVRHSVGTLSVK